jgi:hypothetical protein
MFRLCDFQRYNVDLFSSNSKYFICSLPFCVCISFALPQWGFRDGNWWFNVRCFWCYIKLKREVLIQHPALQEGIVTRKCIVPCSRGIRFTFQSKCQLETLTMTTSSNVTDAFSLTTSVSSVCNNMLRIIHHHVLQALLRELVLML